MIFVQHRVNSLSQLDTLDLEYGAEIDLRSDPNSGAIYLHHDPFAVGPRFEDWIKKYSNLGFKGPLILNTKEDGLESAVISICESNGIKNFFFLDTALPTLVKWTIQNSERRFACRFSAYEPFLILDKFRGKVDWVWVDCFNGLPMMRDEIIALRKYFRVCLVSPELQGLTEIGSKFFELVECVDAICTKKPQAWASLIAK